MGLLSVSFVIASVLAAQKHDMFVRVFYTLSSMWLGFLNFFFLAACLCWMVYGMVRLTGLPGARFIIAETLFGTAALVSIYGFINAFWIRVTRVKIRLPKLPPSWRGRVAALVSDTHLGHVRGYAFISRIVAMLRQLRPDILFIAGDLYDGTRVQQQKLAAPLTSLTPPFGVYFITGNHEEFSSPAQYLDAVRGAGVRTLQDEKAVIDGLQVIGVSYRTMSSPERLDAVLAGVALNPNSASILLAHAPQALAVAERRGISLQLCGHTHQGQTFPFTWFTSRIFREYTYGLQRYGALSVYTSSGAGTWGPPMRVGSRPEIVLIQFE
jgi:predicted MPP superfamily phosphohydrolase